MEKHESFPKKEKLKSTKTIQQLFERGLSWHKYPVRLVYLIIDEDDIPLQAAFSVPKKNFRKAVVRNLLKRGMREAYRRNKHESFELFKEAGKSGRLMFIYTGVEDLPFGKIESSLKILLKHLRKRVQGKVSRSQQ